VTEQLTLTGLDAANPLAFLAALGTVRSLTLAWPEAGIKLHWQPSDGGLRPLLTVPAGIGEVAVLTTLIDQLKRLTNNTALTFANDLTVSAEVFRKAALDARAQAYSTTKVAVDFIAAFACDALTDTKTGIIQDTAWRTMSGAGHQHFLGFMRTLAEGTTQDHLRVALFAYWSYSDPPPSLRWDPVDDRRYALRWDEPSGDPIRTVRGANALAVQGLPLFPTQPTGSTLATTGFKRIPRQGTFFSWPIWADPISLDVIRSLLGMAELQEKTPAYTRLRPFGVIEVFRSQRITLGKYRNFTQGTPV
jgi:hypothetical protein